jgi:hypothetical protein
MCPASITRRALKHDQVPGDAEASRMGVTRDASRHLIPAHHPGSPAPAANTAQDPAGFPGAASPAPAAISSHQAVGFEFIVRHDPHYRWFLQIP